MPERISSRLAADVCVPAPGQGIVAAECRTDDTLARGLLERIRNREAARALDAERALVTALGADCDVPLGALATGDGGQLSLRCVVASPDGRRLLCHVVRGGPDDAVGLGRRAADLLLANGAEALLAAARGLTAAGCVHLIGTGPGDPSLITVRGRQRLAAADVVVFAGRHVQDRLLRWARPDAERIEVDAGASEALDPSVIHRLLADRAGKGMMVAHLTAGDPFASGAAAKAADYLHDRGIRIEVVPGVPPHVAAPGLAGVAITGGDAADAVLFLPSDPAAKDEAPAVDWNRVAPPTATLVGEGRGAHLARIVDELLRHGPVPGRSGRPRPARNVARATHDRGGRCATCGMRRGSWPKAPPRCWSSVAIPAASPRCAGSSGGLSSASGSWSHARARRPPPSSTCSPTSAQTRSRRR